MSNRHRPALTSRLAPLMVMVPALVIPLALGSSCLPDNPDLGVTFAAEGSNILLRVLSTEGEPVPLARVTVRGQVALTDAAGFAQFENLPVGRFHARVDADDFTSAAYVTTMAHGASPYAEVRLFSYPIRESFDASQEADIDADGIHMTVPPDALVDPTGRLVTGMVDVGVVVLDPSEPGALDRLPSHLKATRDGEQVILRSFMMADVDFSQDGVPLQVAPGQLVRVELEFPASVAGSVDVGDQIPAWTLDLDTGSWVEEGTGTVELNESGDKVWVVYASHFSWFNCDLAVTRSNLRCFAVSVQDASGTLIPNLEVTVTDELPGTFKDGGSTYTVASNQGGNCVVAERGTSEPTLSIGQTENLLATANILELLAAEGESSPTLGGESGVCYTTGLEAAEGNDDDRMPTALNASCTPLRITLGPEFTQECTPGEVRICPDYPSEHADRVDTGICKPNKQHCINGGLTRTECEGRVLPLDTEDCTTLADDDCDGRVDDYTGSDGCKCTSTEDAIECYVGPPHTRGRGACEPGTSPCDGKGTFGGCEGGQLPTTEDCLTSDVTRPIEDENCDGASACTGGLRSLLGTDVVLVDAVSDRLGNIYALGYIDKGAVFSFGDSDTSVPPVTEKSTFVVKFAANDRAASFDAPPRVAWARVLADPGGGSTARPTSGAALTIYEDAEGVAAIYVLGWFQGRIDADHVNVAGGADLFVARLNSAGETDWLRSFGGNAPWDAVPTDAAVTKDGAIVYFSGRIYGRFPDFSQGTTSFIDDDPDDADAFILSLDASGETRWAKTYGSRDFESANAIAIDAEGSVFVAGDTTESFDAGQERGLAGTNGNPYLAKFTGEGDALWIQPIASGGGDLRGMVLDSSDAPLLTGTFHSAETDNDVYVARYTGAGVQDFLWSWPNPGSERGEAIDVDALGNLVVTGVFTSEALSYNGASAVGRPGTINVFVAKLNNGNGNPFWMQPSGPTADPLIRSVRTTVASRTYGDVYAMGPGWFAEFAP